MCISQYTNDVFINQSNQYASIVLSHYWKTATRIINKTKPYTELRPGFNLDHPAWGGMECLGGSEKSEARITREARATREARCWREAPKIRLGGLGERRKLPQWGPGRSLVRQKLLAHFSSKIVFKCVSISVTYNITFTFI